MLDTHEFRNIIVVLQHGIHPRRLFGAYEHAHFRDAHDAAPGGHGFDSLIGLAARVIGIQRAAIRMGDEHRLFRKLKSVQRSFVTTMGNIHRHPDLVHALDNAYAKI